MVRVFVLRPMKNKNEGTQKMGGKIRERKNLRCGCMRTLVAGFTRISGCDGLLPPHRKTTLVEA